MTDPVVVLIVTFGIIAGAVGFAGILWLVWRMIRLWRRRRDTAALGGAVVLIICLGWSLGFPLVMLLR